MNHLARVENQFLDSPKRDCGVNTGSSIQNSKTMELLDAICTELFTRVNQQQRPNRYAMTTIHIESSCEP
jgi:hypothetical protein